jgi:CBS domain-containing protein
MQVQEIMTRSVECCLPSDTARTAAEFMREADSGAIPVVSSENDPKVIGIVTDRDLCMDVVAAGRDPNQVNVRECMTDEVVTCRPQDELERIADLMAEKQIRRIPVVDDGGAIVGIVSLADIAQSADDGAGLTEALHDISEPTPKPSQPRGQKNR